MLEKNASQRRGDAKKLLRQLDRLLSELRDCDPYTFEDSSHSPPPVLDCDLNDDLVEPLGIVSGWRSDIEEGLGSSDDSGMSERDSDGDVEMMDASIASGSRRSLRGRERHYPTRSKRFVFVCWFFC